MLFLLKRTRRGALAGFVLLTLLGLGLRRVAPSPPALELTIDDLLQGILVLACVLTSDGLLHGLFLLVFGEPYRRRHLELVAVFRGQTFGAILLGSLMAGVGEELCFRGLDAGPVWLAASAVVFGLMHHLRRSLWMFTLWSIWEGMLFALAMLHLQRLGATMTAHFLHDFIGFLLFKYAFDRRGRDEMRADQHSSPNASGSPKLP